MKLGLLIVLLPLSLLAACGPTAAHTAIPTSTPDRSLETQLSANWRLVEAPGWPSQAGFSLRLPPGWELHELQGDDSYVGEIVGEGVRLTFDYGIYSNSLVDEDDPHHNVAYEEIGGRRAKLVRPNPRLDGTTGVYFGDMDRMRLGISGTGLESPQQVRAFAIFRTIRSLASQQPEGKGDASSRAPALQAPTSSPPTQAPTPAPTPPEAVVRQALRRMAIKSGISEVVPGFGGYFLDQRDNSIFYVYMMDTTQQELAEEAARMLLGRVRFEREIWEVRVLQARYPISQLNEWYGRLWDVVHSVDGVSRTDLNEGKNRIAIGMTARAGARQDMEALVVSLGIPLEAVLIKVGCSDVGEPYEPPPLPDDPVLRSLKVWVEVPPDVKAEVPVQFTLKVKNVAEHTLSVDYGEPPTPDFVVTRSDGTRVWSPWCERGAIAGVGRTLTLEPGEELEFHGLWRQWDGQGEPVSPGSYLVYGVFDTYPGLPAEPVTFRIVP